MEDKDEVEIYKSVIVAENIEIAGNSSTRVTCIECCESRMFVGTAEGYLLEYFMQNDELGANNETSNYYTQVRHTNLNSKSQPIQFIRAASAIESLLIIIGNHLTLFDIYSLESRGTNGIKNISTLAVDENPLSSDPFALHFCFSKKTCIQLARATSSGFNLVREINLERIPLAFSIESGLICAAVSQGYYLMVNSNSKNPNVIQLCDFDLRDKPIVVHVKKEEFLVVGPGGLGVFVTKEGSSERPPILWPGRVSSVVVHNHVNVIGMGQEEIFIHSLADYGKCVKLHLKGLVKTLSHSDGNVYAVAGSTLFKLLPISLPQQIQTLLNKDECDKALHLLSLSNSLKREEIEVLKSKIIKRSVFSNLKQRNWRGATEAILESSIDMREIVSLFPNILPSENTQYIQMKPAVHDFTSISQMCSGDERLVEEIGTYLADYLISNLDPYSTPKDLSTGLIKLSALYSPPQIYENLVKNFDFKSVEISNLVPWLSAHDFHHSKSLILVKCANYREGIDNWIAILHGKIKCCERDKFPGIEIIVDTVSKLTDPSLIWTYFEELLLISPSSAIQIFKFPPHKKPLFSPAQIIEKLVKWPQVGITFLENLSEKDEECATHLASLYIHMVLDSKNEGEKIEWRRKLREFLIETNCLRTQFLIGKLSNSGLSHELAILHGKAGDHRPALELFVREFNDHDLAREYCSKLKDQKERKKAFELLIQIYLLNLEEEETTSRYLVQVLEEFTCEFDLNLILPLLPNDISISIMSTVIQRALRKSLHKKRMGKIQKGLSQQVHYQIHSKFYNSNQGYLVHSESLCQNCSKNFDLNDSISHINGTITHQKCS